MSEPVRLPLRMEFVKRTGVADVYEVCDADGEVLLSNETYYPEAPSREVAEWIVAVSNSHLELLAALKAQQSYEEHRLVCEECGRNLCSECSDACDLSARAGKLRRAAIAKAEGRS